MACHGFAGRTWLPPYRVWSARFPRTLHPVPQPTALELCPAARPHWQAPNLNLNRNLARLRFLEIKSKITIKSGKKPFRLNSRAVHPGPLPPGEEKHAQFPEFSRPLV